MVAHKMTPLSSIAPWHRDLKMYGKPHFIYFVELSGRCLRKAVRQSSVKNPLCHLSQVQGRTPGA